MWQVTSEKSHGFDHVRHIDVGFEGAQAAQIGYLSEGFVGDWSGSGCDIDAEIDSVSRNDDVAVENCSIDAVATDGLHGDVRGQIRLFDGIENAARTSHGAIFRQTSSSLTHEPHGATVRASTGGCKEKRRTVRRDRFGGHPGERYLCRNVTETTCDGSALADGTLVRRNNCSAWQDAVVNGEPVEFQRRSCGQSSILVWLSIGAALILGASCGGGSASLKGMVREDPLKVGAVSITDVTSEGAYSDHGGMFSFTADPGHLLVVYFGYTNCPDLCPTTMALIRSARMVLGDSGRRIDVAMVTVDPNRDTADVLNGYLVSFTDQFHALRAVSSDELRRAEDAFLASSTVTTTATGAIEVGHSATTYVVDASGHVVVEWPFGVDKDTVVNDLRVLLKKA